MDTHEQIRQVPNQSAAHRALDAKVRAKAGEELGPVKVRMKNTNEVLELGYEHARKAVLTGVADVVE